MKNLLPKLQQIVIVLSVVSAIGGGFYSYGVLNQRINQIEAKTKKSVNLTPIKESVATLSTQTDGLEKRLDRLEGRMDKLGNNDNPLAQ